MRVLSPACNPRPPFIQSERSKSDNERAACTSAGSPCTVAVTNSKVPMVSLDTDRVSDNMAARLCVSFLGHVLFLKNQIPFPIVQLARMPTSNDTTTRSSKRRHELLSSFDTLASHLYTTFIALSTALALQGSPKKSGLGEVTDSSSRRKHGVARAFFVVALGPTIATARSRVIMGIDGLETKVWGLREDSIPGNSMQTHALSEGKEEIPVENASDTEGEDEQSKDDESRASSEEQGGFESELDDESPPPSRSPSPAPSAGSDFAPSRTLANISPDSRLGLSVEDPETVRAAERLLSRTLASACAEDDDRELASEMAPTQTYVLLRAPRRFDHPSWIPRQNLGNSLDSYLADFLADSGEIPAFNDATKKRKKVGKAQGVWIRCNRSRSKIENLEAELTEEDELIWWSWDGKLVGFADW